jgi:hypothetical protein
MINNMAIYVQGLWKGEVRFQEMDMRNTVADNCI